MNVKAGLLLDNKRAMNSMSKGFKPGLKDSTRRAMNSMRKGFKPGVKDISIKGNAWTDFKKKTDHT